MIPAGYFPSAYYVAGVMRALDEELEHLSSNNATRESLRGITFIDEEDLDRVIGRDIRQMDRLLHRRRQLEEAGFGGEVTLVQGVLFLNSLRYAAVPMEPMYADLYSYRLGFQNGIWWLDR